jgi:hypothetical protein
MGNMGGLGGLMGNMGGMGNMMGGLGNLMGMMGRWTFFGLILQHKYIFVLYKRKSLLGYKINNKIFEKNE